MNGMDSNMTFEDSLGTDGDLNMGDLGSMPMPGNGMFENDPLGMAVTSVEASSNTLKETSARPEDGVEETGRIINSATGAGAGPLPTGFGAQQSSSGSTLTEFTKRRNWSQRVLEEMKDLLYILTPDGRFSYLSPSCKSIVGHDAKDLHEKLVTDFIHPDDNYLFVREFNESIASGKALRFFFRFKKPDNTYVILESHGHPHLTSEQASYGPGTTPGFCRGFFMMARPYPTKNAELLDSFLEHKVENERLSKRIADLRREEQEENEASARQWAGRGSEGREGTARSESMDQTRQSETPTNSLVSNQSGDYASMPPPAKPSVSNTALTQQNLDEANATSRTDTINDKMARYEGATHIEGIEMLTGLHYREGERSQGISTGDQSPLLIRGDAGIAIPIDKDSRLGNDKKKKLKTADEYVCTDCGTLDSPEWRKGPNGPKTLCNACGLRWAKKEKKRGSNGPTPSGQQPPSLQKGTSSGSG